MRDGSIGMTMIKIAQIATQGHSQMASTGRTLKSSTVAARMDSPPMPFISSHKLSFCVVTTRPSVPIRSWLEFFKWELADKNTRYQSSGSLGDL